MSSDYLPLSRDLKMGRVTIDKDILIKVTIINDVIMMSCDVIQCIQGEAKDDQWYRIQPLDIDSEVQVMIIIYLILLSLPPPQPPPPLRVKYIYHSVIENSLLMNRHIFN